LSAATQPELILKVPASRLEQGLLSGLAILLDAVPFACLRLQCDAIPDENIKATVEPVHAIVARRDLPLVIEDHIGLARTLGLDGVHLCDGAKHVRDARKALGPDAIVGAYCGNSRHSGMSAAEMTADYVSFGPIQPGAMTGDSENAAYELFDWWATMIEVPVVAEGGLVPDALRTISEKVDFLCLGDEIWLSPLGPLPALKAFLAALKG
jgi:thiamine-phosphate pyrophosphorylase